MFEKDGRTISLESAQAAAGRKNMSIEEWASNFGWAQGEGEPKKTNDSVVETATVESVPMTSGGESISGDISLEQSEANNTGNLNDFEKAKQDLNAITITAEEDLAIRESIDIMDINAQVAAKKNIGINEVVDEDRASAIEKEIAKRRREALNLKVEDIAAEYSDGTISDWGMNIARGLARMIPGADLNYIDKTFRTDSQKEILANKESIANEYGKKYEEAVSFNNKGIKEFNKYQDLIEIADSELDELKNAGKADEYETLRISRNAMAEKAMGIWEEVSGSTEGIETMAEIKDMMGRTYSESDIAFNRAEATARRFVAGVAKLGAEVTPNAIAERMGDYTPIWAGAGIESNVRVGLDKVSDALNEDADFLTSKLRKRQEFMKIDKPADVIDFAIDLFSEQAINTAVTVGLPGAGLFLVSGSAGGQKMTEMDVQIAEGKKISAAQFYGAATMHAAGEYITESVSLGGAKKALGLSKKAAKVFDFIPDATNMAPSYIKAAARWGGGAVKEGSAELGSQVFANVADKYILGEDISITDGLAESFWSGAFMSGIGFGAPALAQDLYRASTTGAEMRANTKRVEEMVQIKDRLDKLYLDQVPDESTAKAISLLQQRADELAMENVEGMLISNDRIDELSRSDKRVLLDTESEAHRVRSELDEIDNNPKLTAEEKLSLGLEPLGRLTELGRRKDAVLGNAENSKAKANARSVQMQAAAELGLDFEYINAANTEEATTAAIDYVNNSDLDDKAKAKLISELNKAKDTEGVNGFYIGAELGLPIALSTDEGASRNSSVAAHEVAHATIFKALLDGNADMIAIADNLESYMVTNYKGAKARFDKVRQDYPKSKFSEKDIAEERLNAIVEYARQKNIKLDQTISGKLMTSWNNIRSPKVAEVTEIKTGKDVLDLIISFNSSFDKGELSGLAKKVASKDVKAATTTASESSNNKKFSQSGKPTVLESINALVPADVTTKAEFQNRKVFNAVYAATEPGGAISNYVRSKSESKEVADKAMESVVDRLINYDPAAVRKKANGDPITFGEFIFANTNFGKLDARKSLAIEAKETARKISIDSEQAKEIADKDTATDSRDSDKPRRMNLLTRGVVSAEAISKATKVVEGSIRALKVPFNKQTSLNVTVKPYIAALKKGFADKALVKAVAQEMGNGGDLKSWMRKHKAAILDNMTTTYLIGAFPAAIQKQVKGTNTWTSDWAGKEIQREKTTTGNAGRTSGAFMVRRLPNASSKISDADFVGMLFDDKGVIKPGKKPSLAKAIAEEIGFDVLSTEIQNPNGKIAEAFKDNQSALGAIVLSNTVATLNKDAERGSAKFSLGTAQQKEITDTQDKFLKSAIDLNMPLTQTRVAGVMREVYDPKIFSENDILAFAKEAWKDVKRYIDKIDLTKNISLPAFLQEGIDTKKMITNIMLQLGLTKDDISNGAKALYENKNLVDRQRGLSFDYVGDLIQREGEAGLLKVLKYMRGHQTTSGKIGGGRMQIYAGNSDFIANNLNLHPGVEVVWGATKEGGASRIQSVKYNGVKVEGKFNSFTQSTKPSKETFIKEYAEREAEANEAKEVLLDYLSFIRENGNRVDWFMTMMSLKSNMASVLKAAAAAKYYYDGPAIGALRYEHMLSTEFMAQKLTEHFYIKKIDLDTLFGKYKVAIIPIKMDDNFNVQRQTSAGADFDFNNDPEYKRYYDAATYGYPNMYALEILGGNLKGQIVGKAWVNANKIMAPYAGRVVAENRKSDKALNESSAKFSIAQEQDMSKAINDMIERTKDVQSEKVFSAVQAKKRGKTIGKYKFFSPAADDFRGLTSYTFAGKGKQGDADQKFFEETLIKPYQRGINAIDVAKQTIKSDFTAVVKAFAPQAKVMRKKIPGSDYTYDQAIRVYMWTRQGEEVPGMSKRDLALLNKTIAEDPAMIAFADAMLLVSKQGEWMAPGEHWLTNTVLSDLNNMSERIGRKVYLEEFLAAKDIIFSSENMAKIEAVYGAKYTSALKDSLYRMENGTNRPSGDDATTNRWLNWINQSTGAIMFFNRRSAVLQLLSTVNFINWSDNNPAKAAMAFANQKQFWADFSMLFNSPKLKQRRAGLKTDVTQAEIANAVAGQTNKAAAALNYLLKIGFTPTQIADSFAVASGGASFYRNRVNTYLKQGKSQEEAETLAFEEFSSTADEAQQSSDPMLISQQQASVLGRLVLAFQNTTMQYTRLMKKATLDLVNGRGDWKTNVSKIIYYGGVQNFVFSALQSALFSFIPGFGDDEEYDEEDAKNKKLEGATARIINSMIDSILRGSGLTGAVVSTLKNAVMKYMEQEEKGYNADHVYTFLSIMAISPPMGSKLSKLYKAQQTKRFEQDALQARPFGIVADGRVNLGPGYRIVGNIAAATVNFPLDRVVDEVTSLSEALDNRNTEWQRLALAVGWKSWAVGAKNEEHDLLKAEGKVRRKAEGKVQAAETRAANKKAEAERYAGLTREEKAAEKKAEAIAKREKRIAAKEARIAAKKKAAAQNNN